MMTKILAIIFILAAQVSAQESSASTQGPSAIWQVTQDWSVEWEQKFSAWVAREVDTDFFNKHNIATDCADAAIGLRWIFARRNGLPAAITLVQRTAKGLEPVGLMTQDSVGPWSKLPTHSDWWQDRRFLSALRAAFGQAFTHTLLLDGYPVSLSKQGMAPGTFFVTKLEQTGHTQIITRVDWNKEADNPITLFASTVPATVRNLNVDPFVLPHSPILGEDGFMRFRWPVKTEQGWVLTAPEQMPWYSMEQYDQRPIFREGWYFDDYAIYRIANYRRSAEAKMKSIANALVLRLQERVSVVEEGFRACHPNRCHPDSAIYDSHSTPNRDRAIRYIFAMTQAMIFVESSQNGSSNLEAAWRRASRKPVLEIFGKKMNLQDFSDLFLGRKTTDDPNHSVEQRWGF